LGLAEKTQDPVLITRADKYDALMDRFDRLSAQLSDLEEKDKGSSARAGSLRRQIAATEKSIADLDLLPPAPVVPPPATNADPKKVEKGKQLSPAEQADLNAFIAKNKKTIAAADMVREWEESKKKKK
jgi:hypothetical protein